MVVALHMYVVEKLVKAALCDGEIKFLNPVIYCLNLKLVCN